MSYERIQQAGAHQSQLGHQQQREGQRDRQGTQVVEGQHLRDQIERREARRMAWWRTMRACVPL